LKNSNFIDTQDWCGREAQKWIARGIEISIPSSSPMISAYTYDSAIPNEPIASRKTKLTFFTIGFLPEASAYPLSSRKSVSPPSNSLLYSFKKL